MQPTRVDQPPAAKQALRLSADFWTTLIVLAAIGSTIYCLSALPADAAKIAIPIIVTLATGQIAAVRSSKANADKIDVLTPQVEQVAAQVAPLAKKVDTIDTKADAQGVKLDETHGLVNGQAEHLSEQTTKFESALVEMSAQRAENAALKAEIDTLTATARSTLLASEEAIRSALAVIAAHAKGMEEGKQQIIDDTAAMAVAVANDPDASPTEPHE